MAGTSRATKSKRGSRKKKTRSHVKQRRKATPSSDRVEVAAVAPAPAVLRPDANKNQRLIAVIDCVNRVLDTNRHGWNEDGHGDTRTMDKDFHYDENSMPAFLGAVSDCLAPKYTFTFDSIVRTCVSSNVALLKFHVFMNTK